MMNNRSDGLANRHDTKRVVASQMLKKCTLCNAVNALNNPECFVCGWHGIFELDPVQIEEGVHQLLDRCPELAAAMLEEIPVEQARPTWLRRVFNQLNLWFSPHRKVKNLQAGRT